MACTGLLPPPTIGAIRADFPILDQQVHGQPLIYFDNAATTQKPRAVIEALRQLLRARQRQCPSRHSRTEQPRHRGLRGARARAANSSTPAARTRSSSRAAPPRASTWWRKPGARSTSNAGDKILLTEMEHHSNIVPWQLLAERTGAQLRLSASHGTIGLLDLSRLTSCSRAKVKLFAMTHISNSLGTINPVAELVRAGAPARRDHAGGCRAKRRAPAD